MTATKKNSVPKEISKVAENIARTLILVLVLYAGMKWWGNHKLLEKEADTRVRFIVAAQNARCGLVESDPITGKIIFADNIACKLFGYSPGELTGQPMAVLLPAYFAEVHLQRMRDAIKRVKADPKAPRVIVVKCEGRAKGDKPIIMVTRAFVSPETSTVFATMNISDDILFQSTPGLADKDRTDIVTPLPLTPTPPKQQQKP